MSNAVKYTPDGGKISLSIREILCNQEKVGCYEFVSKDNGTGLGMPITRNIVHMMGGDIKVESKLNEGSTFTVTIFLKLQDTDAGDQVRFADLSVLVADDDEMSMESAVDILGELGMRAEGVLSSEAAVERVTAHHRDRQDYQAVILDWKMPDMDGVETARAIRAEVGEAIPIIILSAYDWTDIEAEAVEAVTTAEDGKYDLVLMDIQMPKMNGNDATRAIRASERKYCKTVPIIAMTANAFAEDVQAARTAGMNEHIAKPLDLKVLAKVLNKWLLKKV